MSYCLKIYNTSDVKVAEITSDVQHVTIAGLEFELLQNGGCGSFSFTLAKPYTQATIDRDYRVDIHCFNSVTPWYSGKIINKPVAGTGKEQTYSGWGYSQELEKKLILTSIAPAQNIKAAVEGLLDTFITPYTSILKDTSLIEAVAGHTLVATIDVIDEEARWIFDRLREIAVQYKFGVRADRKFYFQSVDSSIQQYWHVGKHLDKFLPEEDASELVKKVIAAPDSQIFSDGYELRVTSEAGDYAGLYEKRFSIPEIISPFAVANIASGKDVSTSPTGTGASNITDDNYATLWASGTNQASGHYIEIDLGADFDNIAKVVIDSIHDNAKEFVAQSIKIEIKPDGGSYSTILQTDEGIGWKPAITFRPTTGRYIKLSLTETADVEWKVGEVEVHQLDLADVQRWTDGQLAIYENVLKRATARIENVTSLISPTGKARIFDTDGTKIDDYQIVACKYSLSANSKLAVNFELGVEERGPADHLKDLERRIREAELTGVRRAENLSLGKGLQLGSIVSTYIGPKSIQTPMLEVDSLWARHYHELRNTYVFSDQDSLDASKSFEMDFEIVSEMTAIVSVKLSFRIKQFRAYAKGMVAGGAKVYTSGGGGAVVKTSSSGGAQTKTSTATGTPSGGGKTTYGGGAVVKTSSSGGGQTKTSTSTTHNHPGSTSSEEGSPNHYHRLPIPRIGTGGLHYAIGLTSGYLLYYEGVSGNTVYPNTQAPLGAASHSHGLNISNDGAHTHQVTIDNHTHTVTLTNHDHGTPTHTHPDHTHNVTIVNHTHTVTLVNHTHTVSIVDHTHNLTFGIYEASTSPIINVFVSNDGGETYGNSISADGDDHLDMNITGISGSGWKRKQCFGENFGDYHV